MRCNEIEELLSVYANDEATEAEQKTVEEHLAGCKDCRAKLENLLEVRLQLASLRETPSPPMTAEAVSAVLAKGNHTSPFHSWKFRTFAAVPLVVIIVLLAVLQPWSSPLGPDAVLARAHDAIAEVSSYRYSLTASVNGTYIEKYYMEFSAPDKAYIREDIDGNVRKYIVLGDDQYYLGDFPSPSHVLSQIHMFSSWISREFVLDMFDKMKDIEELPAEDIEGVACVHYRGLYDFEKDIRSRHQAGYPPMSEERIQEEIEMFRERLGNRYIELWIGKDDYLLRQMNTESKSVTQSYKYCDFNEPITIAPPLDTDGQLLPGWATMVPDEQAFEIDVLVEISNQDPANREINYYVTLTNVYGELLGKIRTDILPLSSESGIWTRWTLETDRTWDNPPWWLEDGQDLEFCITYGYNATTESPGMIAEAIENSGLYVTYEMPDGQKKGETIHFQAPEEIYTMPTEVTGIYNLEPISEFIIEAAGASRAGQAVHGEINGREYLFTTLDTLNNDTGAAPGILVLDIENPIKPVKVAYLEASANIGFLYQLAVSGMNLYVCTDSCLWILDISDPAHPRELAQFSEVNGSSLTVSGKLAYIFEHGRRQITTLDVSDPSSPQMLGSLDFPTKSLVTFIIAEDCILAESRDTLYIIDALLPGSLRITDTRTFALSDGTPANPGNMAAAGNFLYLTLSSEDETGLLILDISNPWDPSEVAYLEAEQHLLGPLLVHQGTVYVFAIADSPRSIQERINIFYVTDPANPEYSGFARMPDFWSFFDEFNGGGGMYYTLVDGYLYWFIAASPNQPRIEIFDLAGLTE